MKGWLLVLLCAATVWCLSVFALAEDAGLSTHALDSRFTLAEENERLALYVDEALCDIALLDKQSGAVWYSNPPDASEDKVASGMPKQQMLSQLYVKYVDDKNNSFFAASRFSAVDQGGAVLIREEDAITVVMDFRRDEFKIPVRYSLGDDHLRAEVLLDQIEEYGLHRINQITLLPFFGAGGPEDSGYVFLPDGSGALVRFNNGKQASGSITLNVYGDEIVFGRELVDTSRQKCHLPVFGIQRAEDTLLAVIHEGAAKSAITVTPGGRYTGYTTVSATYNLRLLGSVKLPTKNFQNRSVQVLEDGTGQDAAFEVRYYPLTPASGYVGMAQRYRTYLIEEASMPAQNTDAGAPGLYLDVTGAVNLKKPILGIPAHVVTPLTPFDGAAALLTNLRDLGVESITLRYSGWNGGGLYGKLPAKSQAEGRLGGNAGLKTLLSTADALGAKVYLGADLMNVYQTGAGVNRFFDTAQNINRTVSLQYRYLPNTFLADTETEPWLLLAPRLLSEKHQAYGDMVVKATGGAPVGIAMETTGNLCYSDFSGKPSSREQTAAYSAESLAGLEARGFPLLLAAANAYALPQAHAITHVPDGASGYDLADQTVPFYQIVLHGLVDMASLPVNLCAQPRLRLLKCIEMGMSPTYAMITGDASVLKNTRADMLYGVSAAVWAKAAAEGAQEVAEALAGTEGQAIIDHEEVMPGITRTVYESGRTVWVNTTNRDMEGTSITVPAMGWAAIGGTAP